MEAEIEKKEEENTKKSGGNSFWELARFALLAIAIVIPIRMFIAQPFIVSGSSMVPTFTNGEYLIVDELSYKLGEPERGDVVIFRYPNDQKKFFIKRIIGLPNEIVEIDGSTITITNEETEEKIKLDEPYVKNISENNIRFELRDDEYYVMGDNRTASSDSRYWGAVPKKLLIGKAFLRLLPISRIDLAPGDYKQAESK
jgi:signal peptidase I